MKCNYKNVLKRQVAKDIDSTMGTVKRLWELLTLLTLHREFGFGKERLKRFAEAQLDMTLEFTERATASDKYDRKRGEYTNIDGAIINALRELRADGIDHREILGENEEFVIIDENGKQRNLDEFLDSMEGRL